MGWGGTVMGKYARASQWGGAWGRTASKQWRVFFLRQTQAISDVASPSQRNERTKDLDLG